MIMLKHLAARAGQSSSDDDVCALGKMWRTRGGARAMA